MGMITTWDVNTIISNKTNEEPQPSIFLYDFGRQLYEGHFCKGKKHGKGRLSKISECKTFVEVKEGIYDDGVAIGEHVSNFHPVPQIELKVN